MRSKSIWLLLLVLTLTAAAGFFVYPNPANDHITIATPSFPATVSITDVSGQVIMQANITSSETKIDVSALASGCYLISVQTENGRAINKMMKE